MIRFGHVTFRYDPFPIGVATELFEEGLYRELVASYPPDALFVHDPHIGGRYTLTPYQNGAEFQAHLRRAPAWGALARWVASADFLTAAIDMLLTHAVDLGVPRRDPPLTDRLSCFARGVRRGRLTDWRTRPLVTVAFAMLPAQGGALLPHTDDPKKLVNFALPMVAPDTWDARHGGHTDINRPKDVRHWFNRANRRLSFDEVDVIESIPYRPNQALIVVRGDNSWHSVPPMTAADPVLKRRSVNINIQTPE